MKRLILLAALLCSGCAYDSHPDDPSVKPGWRVDLDKRESIESELTPNYSPKPPQ